MLASVQGFKVNSIENKVLENFILLELTSDGVRNVSKNKSNFKLLLLLYSLLKKIDT